MLGDYVRSRLDELLLADDATREARFSGNAPGRQPVHTVYIPADRYHHGIVEEWGTAALDCLDEYGPLPGFSQDAWARLEGLVHRKLTTEPIEDLRIDFEDGYGTRSDGEEDEHIRLAARALAESHADRSAPLTVGLRIKSLEGATRARAVRTFDFFLERLHAEAATLPERLGESPVPESFRITLPKVTSVVQVVAMVELCRALEAEYGMAAGRLRFEIQVEAPQAIVGPDGSATVAQMLHSAQGRCAGLHFGTYDYSTAVGIAAAFQSLEHPAAEFAKQVMQVAAAGTGIPISDGSTNILPIGDLAAVRAGWELHARLVRRSLERGFYQGWDLHPAQLPTRYAATFAFYQDGLPAAVERLQRYLGRAASPIIDEPATAQALASFLSRGLDCGAFDEDAIAELIGEGGVPLDRSNLDRLAQRRPVSILPS
jgi:uncharacterized protein DUF6986